MPLHTFWRVLCLHYVPLSAPTTAFLPLRMSTEQISVKYAGFNHYH